MPLVVFRADGGPAIGAGHVMRALALASAFRAGGWSIGFAATAETFAAVAALRKWPLEPLQLGSGPEGEGQTLRRRWPGGADILVVDHYGRDACFERPCRGWARRIVVIDDLADRPHEADVLVDAARLQSAYRGLVPEGCEVLAGPQYAAIDPAFRSVRAAALPRRDGRPVERVLVSFGQIDAADATSRALRALDGAGFAGRIDVALGSAAPHLAAVQAAASERVRVQTDVQDMARLMAEADLAVGAGGVTALERCCLGLPSVLVTLAQNQREIVAMLTAAGAAADAGRADAGLEGRLAGVVKKLLNDREQRAAMARAGAALVDGRGAERIMLAAIGSCAIGRSSAVRLRLAGTEDEAWLFQLQSYPETRRYANDPSPPTPEGHHKWLARTLADPSRLLMVAEVNGRSAGMLRLDRREQAERVNIAVDPQYHRQGVGRAILALAARLRPGSVLDAEVLPDNAASRALFAGAGYRQVGERLFRREPV